MRKHQKNSANLLLSQFLREKLPQRRSGHTAGRSWLEAIGLALLRKAAGGDMAAIKEIADRTEGKAAQRVEIDGSDEGPVKMSTEEFLQRFEEMLGLYPRPAAAKAEDPGPAGPVPGKVDQGQEPAKYRDKS